MFQAEFVERQGGQVGITLNVNWGEPEDDTDPAHLEASQRFMDFFLGWYAHPIFVSGKYPEVREDDQEGSLYISSFHSQIMRSMIDEKSAAQGFNESRLPHFSEEDSAMILGSSDFLGLNIYTSYLVFPEEADIAEIDFYADQDVGSFQDDTWTPTGASWLKVRGNILPRMREFTRVLQVTPWGIRSAVRWASERYNHPDIYITENGVSTKLRNLDDLHRWDLIRKRLVYCDVAGCIISNTTSTRSSRRSGRTG